MSLNQLTAWARIRSCSSFSSDKWDDDHLRNSRTRDDQGPPPWQEFCSVYMPEPEFGFGSGFHIDGGKKKFCNTIAKKKQLKGRWSDKNHCKKCVQQKPKTLWRTGTYIIGIRIFNLELCRSGSLSNSCCEVNQNIKQLSIQIFDRYPDPNLKKGSRIQPNDEDLKRQKISMAANDFYV